MDDYFESLGMGSDYPDTFVSVEGGEAVIEVRDSDQFHIDRGKDLGYAPNFDAGALRTAMIADAPRGMAALLEMDTSTPGTVGYSIYLGGYYTDRKDLDEAIELHWEFIAHIANATDPGSFGTRYLFDHDGMRLELAA